MIEDCREALMSAFSCQTAGAWFGIALTGFLIRTELLGVSSIVRALALTPNAYPCLLHFILTVTDRGRIILIASDLTLAAADACKSLPLRAAGCEHSAAKSLRNSSCARL